MISPVCEAVREFFAQFNPAMLEKLGDIYADNIRFQDPLHEVNGINSLRTYFAGTMEGLEECRFEFSDSLEFPARGEAVLFWTMHYRHHKLAGGKLLHLEGNSHLRFAHKVYYQRDYYDAGAMLYEQVPVIGSVVRHIKGRLKVG